MVAEPQLARGGGGERAPLQAGRPQDPEGPAALFGWSCRAESMPTDIVITLPCHKCKSYSVFAPHPLAHSPSAESSGCARGAHCGPR